MLAFVDERKQLKIFVTQSAKDIVSRFADDFDMTEKGVASRIYERFGRLPLPIQKWFVGLLEPGEGKDLQRLIDEIDASKLPIGEMKINVNEQPTVPRQKIAAKRSEKPKGQ